MKKNYKEKKVRKKIRAFHFVLFILLLALIGTGYYWAKINERFGLKKFVQFSLPLCREPFILFPRKLNSNKSNNYVDSELGYSISMPDNWTVDTNCRAQACLNSPDLSFDKGVEKGARLVLHRVSSTYNFDQQNQDFDNSVPPTTLFGFIQRVFSCEQYIINGSHALLQKTTAKPSQSLYYVEGDQYIYILEPENFSKSNEKETVLNQLLASFTVLPTQLPNYFLKQYNGIPSYRIPYKNITFQEINFVDKQVQGVLNNTIIGYTFFANENELITFLLLAPNSINHLTNVEMELYSYGPTVVKKTNRLEFRTPVTGRYFLVIKNLNPDQDREYRLRFYSQY